MANMFVGDKVQIALKNIENQLPDLVGEEGWKKIKNEFNEKIEYLRNQNVYKQSLIANQIDQLLSDYPKAREHFQIVINQIDTNRGTQLTLARMAKSLGINKDVIENLVTAIETENLRYVKMSTKGINKATSIKINNIEFDFRNFGPLVAETVLIVKEIIKDTNPLFMVAGVIAIAMTFYTALSKEIGEQEAKVLWGFIQACDENNEASKELIKASTFIELRKYKLDTLTKSQVSESLKRLAQIFTVTEFKPGYWRIIEKYTIQ